MKVTRNPQKILVETDTKTKVNQDLYITIPVCMVRGISYSVHQKVRITVFCVTLNLNCPCQTHLYGTLQSFSNVSLQFFSLSSFEPLVGSSPTE